MPRVARCARMKIQALLAATVLFVTRGAHNLVGQVISPNAGAVV